MATSAKGSTASSTGSLTMSAPAAIVALVSRPKVSRRLEPATTPGPVLRRPTYAAPIASGRRNDREWLAALLGDRETRILPLRDLKPFTRGSAAPALDWQPVAQWRDQIDTGATLLFLGLGDGRAHFAIDATGADVAADVDTELVDVR